MPDSELVDYIQEQTQQGVTAQDLRVSLMQAGWHESDINNALHDVAAGLRPATPGASIHEDLAQVRGMVSHLATRVHSIEAILASVGSLGMQEQLPSGTLGPAREISGPTSGHWFGRLAALVVLGALFVTAGLFVSDALARHSLSPRDGAVIAATIGAFAIVVAVIAMRHHHAWTATLLAASGITLWGMDVFLSWRVYGYMGWTVALALGVLLIVVAFVFGRWIPRYSR